MVFDKAQAILVLRPGSQFNIRNGVIEWLDQFQTQPSDENIQAVLDAHIGN